MPHRHRARAARASAFAALPVAALTLAACTSGSGSTGASTDRSSTSSTATTTAARVANVSITAAQGCVSDASTLRAGGVTFKVTNKDAAAVSEIELLSGERIIGEKENLPPGFSGEFSANVTAGTYTLYCPGAVRERTPMRVTGTAGSTGDSTVSAELAAAAKGYAGYVNTQVAALLTAVKKLDTALHGTNLAQAQAAYMRARPFYEKIEPVAESFHTPTDNLDTDIDVRIGDTAFSKWRGFHRVEYGLFKQRSIAGLAAFGDRLVADVTRLSEKTASLQYQPTELANGAVELLDEVAKSKITGEEEAYSHIDLLDFANNDEGAEQAFAQLKPALASIDSGLTSEISAAFAALDKLVNSYRTSANPSGFELYSQLTTADKRALAAAVKAVAEPLSQVGAKVATAS